MIYWHFTSTVHWPHIDGDGKLRRTETNLDMVQQNAGPPAVWLLDGPGLDGAPHGLEGSLADKTEVRFELDIPWRVVKWLDWARAQGIEQSWLETLVRVGGGWEAAERWLISFKEIPRERWVRVENVRLGEELWSR